LAFVATIGERNITEFNYRLASRDEARIFVGIETKDPHEAGEIARVLERRGYRCHDLTDNELAKSHVRHMVGGRSRAVRDEALFSFEFPERPGALLKFLNSLGSRWNISLFHYRNNGGAYGRVLCGLEASGHERGELPDRLTALGFAYREETANPAVEFFLR
jgi:threonine dehydratase